uniref:Uncharacterized protein n=1 Tax=Glossina austeni TaxID=7395 RepID=A0A1A9VUW9_GLOAU
MDSSSISDIILTDFIPIMSNTIEFFFVPERSEILFNPRIVYAAGVVETYLNIFTETRRIIVSDRFSVTESLQDRISCNGRSSAKFLLYLQVSQNVFLDVVAYLSQINLENLSIFTQTQDNAPMVHQHDYYYNSTRLQAECKKKYTYNLFANDANNAEVKAKKTMGQGGSFCK